MDREKDNDSVLEELEVQRSMLTEIIRRKMKYVGHATRNPRTTLMATLLQGRVEARRRRGRPHTSYMENITESSGLPLSSVVHQSRDRREWRAIVRRTEAATAEPGDADR